MRGFVSCIVSPSVCLFVFMFLCICLVVVIYLYYPCSYVQIFSSHFKFRGFIPIPSTSFLIHSFTHSSSLIHILNRKFIQIPFLANYRRRKKKLIIQVNSWIPKTRMKGCKGREGIHAYACNTYVSSSYIMNRRGRKKTRKKA